MNHDTEGRVRIGPWLIAWHPAWWASLLCLVAAVLLFVFVEPADCYGPPCASDSSNYDRAARVFTAVALAAYFWAYGQWRRLGRHERSASDAERVLVVLFGLILAMALWPLYPPTSRCGPPAAALTPWYGDRNGRLPDACAESLDQRQTQLILLGLLAIPPAVAAARDAGGR
ncbi:hypothetical protein [Microbispora sp. NPDC046933]|uniref:hypothetical protein n=1 Tax=Microbispora sp. NPDC046933 TaxID=3155618 RepID=UPI0033FAB4D3